MARTLTVAATVLALACLADWTIDRWRDTPWALRYGLLASQAVLWTVLATAFLIRLLLRRLSNSKLALHVEECIPQLQHRLVSAVQLNQRGAATEGMSGELIAAVTRQAEEKTAPLHFASLADHRRLRWSLALLAPVALTAGLTLLLWPDTVMALLARQFLADQDIPRSLLLESDEAERVCPAGEEVVLRFRAEGELSSQAQGEVRIAPEGQPAERYPLELESTTPGGAVFLAHIPPSTADFSYHARLQDARTRRPGHVHFEAQPAIIELHAWAQLPEFCGRRPSGKPYEREQPSGDLALLPSSVVRVAVRTQKPVQKAYLEVLAAVPLEASHPEPEQVLRRIDLAIQDDAQAAEGTFTPQEGEAAYRVVVVDAYGFRNVDPPRRSIRILADELPRVALLPELFPSPDGQGSTEDFEVSGIPVPLGGTVRIAYTCSSPYGLGRADQNRTPRLCYRVNEGSWWRLPLKEVAGSQKTGPFDPRYGAFENSSFMDQVEYHAVSSPDPEKALGRIDGGGRFDLHTRRIPRLKVGDRLELCLEVYDQNPDPSRPPGRSESRIKSIVTLPEVETWVRETLQEESRIRQLEGKQESIFAVAGTPEQAPSSLEPSTVAEAARPDDHPLTPATPFVRTWQLIGPFGSAYGQGHDKVFPIETEKIDLGRAYDGAGGKVRWKLHRGDSDRIELDRIFQYVYAGAGYAVCWVHSDKPRKLLLAVGSDDGIKVWIDRRVVLDRKLGRPAMPGEDRELFDLKAGWSEILVKVDNLGGTWGFFFELRDPHTNQMAQGLKYSVQSPTKPSGGFLRRWQIIGPFPNVNDGGHQQAFGPETDDTNLNREYAGLKGKVRWKLHESETDKIDLQQLLDHDQAGVAYAVCWVRSPKPKALLATGSDDGIKVWLNRRVVLDRPVHREAVPGEDQTPIELKQDWNEVLVKVDNRFGTWAFFLELREPDGSGPLANVEVLTTPPVTARPAQLGNAFHYLRSWQLLGPLPTPPEGGYDKVYAPEAEKITLGKEYAGIAGNVRWKLYQSKEDKIDLRKYYNHAAKGVAYAVCWVHSDKDRPAELNIGSDDGIKIWLNRQLAFGRNELRGAVPGQDKTLVMLKPGWQEVLVKVDNRGGNDWAFYLELKDPRTRKAIPGLKVRTTPP
jgi:hypothetical protein